MAGPLSTDPSAPERRPGRDGTTGVGASLRRLAVRAERWWDGRDVAPSSDRLEPYLGHGDGRRAVVRGRLLTGPAPAEATPGESTLAAAHRTLASFSTRERARVQLRVRLGAADVAVTTDDEGYLDVRLEPGLGTDAGPWLAGSVALPAGPDDDTRGPCPVHVRVPGPHAAFGVISDVDDTVLVTGARRPLRMLRHTFTGSALTRRTFPGAAELYRALAAGRDGPETNPVFYVSSSPWNLHSFLLAFLEHRGFPRGPLLLRDLLGSGRRTGHAEGKLRHVAEILDLHPSLSFVLLGDSGQDDPAIYLEVARLHPGRILAVCIRDVGGREHPVPDGPEGPDAPVPTVRTASSRAMAHHLAGLGLLSAAQADRVTDLGP